MSRYRILEKRGAGFDAFNKKYCYIHNDSVVRDKEFVSCPHCNYSSVTHVPRYIVQALALKCNGGGGIFRPSVEKVFIDLKEFTDLSEARLFKWNRELDDGIVIE